MGVVVTPGLHSPQIKQPELRLLDPDTTVRVTAFLGTEVGGSGIRADWHHLEHLRARSPP